MDDRNVCGDEPTPRLPRPAESADEQRSEFAYDCSVARVARERTIFGQLEASATVAEVLKKLFASGRDESAGHDGESASHDGESASYDGESASYDDESARTGSATRGTATAKALPQR